MHSVTSTLSLNKLSTSRRCGVWHELLMYAANQPKPLCAAHCTVHTFKCCRFDYNNLIQGVGYLMAKLDPANKDKYLNPIREVMKLWLTASSNITYTPKVKSVWCILSVQASTGIVL